MLVGKALFMLYNWGLYGVYRWDELLCSMWHGLRMDLSMCGYLAAPVAVLAFCQPSKAVYWIWRCWSWLISALTAWAVCLDAVLYTYWGFKLDATPLFYFFSSPASALASAPWWLTVCGLVAMAGLCAGLHWCLNALWRVTAPTPSTLTRKSVAARAGLCAVCLGLLFLAIRGGITVGTMNLSTAYYTADARLCHAAINPLFSVMYSLAHQGDDDGQVKYFDDAEMHRHLAALYADSTAVAPERPRLTAERPDVYIIILESFSAQLMPSLGGEAIATGLDSIAGEGLSWTRCYASSFRTDRALTAVLSGYPALPTTSIIRYTDKIERLPSLPRVLRDSAGYQLRYYYGGDASFTNMAAYIRSMGFDRLVTDGDFPVGERLSKWGVHDDVLLRRATADRASYHTSSPTLTVIQTSSSHEPFEVPYRSGLKDERANAFAYTDH